MFFLTSRRFRHADTGTAAIEYAILAGLIGLGIVGSLVATKGSLSGVYGTASSQMGSSAATSGSATQSPSVAFTFAQKTLSSRDAFAAWQQGRSDGVTTYMNSYTDGSYIVYAAGSNVQGESYTIYDKSLSSTYGVVRYALAVPGQNQPENAYLSSPLADGKELQQTVIFGTDGTAAVTYKTVDGNNTVATSTAVLQRSAFDFVTTMLPEARRLTGQ